MVLRTLYYAAFMLCVWLGTVTTATASPALVLDVSGPIGPATSDYLQTGFARAREQNSPLLVLRMDTPGGLDAAMRDIVKEILASPVPVVGFVAPSGARAASAGTYILQACHLAAMAPATTLGSATPVQLGGLPRMPNADSDAKSTDTTDETADIEPAEGPAPVPDNTRTSPGSTMERKLINDAAAYMRGLAKLRGRNTDWAERAVRSADNLAAVEALDQKVIDLIAIDVADLLMQLDGRAVKVLGDETLLSTTGLTVEVLNPGWRTQLLHVLTDPNVAYVLLLIGIYGLIYELANPGAMVPGVSGAIALTMALYAFQVLPVNFAGLALLALGIVFMTLESFVPSFGVLGVGGSIAFVAGSILLFRDDAGQIGVAWPVIATFVVLSAGLFIGVIGYAVRSRHSPVVSGAEEMIGAIGEALEDFDARGRILVHSESWVAQSDHPVRRGERVRVVAMDGLMLKVEEAVND